MLRCALCYITVPCSRGETETDEPYEPRDDGDDDDDHSVQLCNATSTSDNQVTIH